MKRYTKEIRITAVKAILDKKLTKHEAVEVFGCDYSTLTRWLFDYKLNQKCEPTPAPGRPRTLSIEDEKRIVALVTKKPDVTLEEIIITLELPIKKSTVHNCLVRNGLNFKKNTEGGRTR